jgi:Holliday junction resolvase RusA-like endonuclease
VSDWITSFWLPGQPPRKSNSRMVVRNRGRLRVIKSPEARGWVRQSISMIGPELRILGLGSADKPLRILFEVYYETRRPDLSVELILDTLEEAGVISNDRHVYEYTARKFFSKDMPGVMVHVGYMREQPQDTDAQPRFEVAGKLGPWARLGMEGERYLAVGPQGKPAYRRIADARKADDGTWRYVRTRIEHEDDYHHHGCGTNIYKKMA